MVWCIIYKAPLLCFNSVLLFFLVQGDYLRSWHKSSSWTDNPSYITFTECIWTCGIYTLQFLFSIIGQLPWIEPVCYMPMDHFPKPLLQLNIVNHVISNVEMPWDLHIKTSVHGWHSCGKQEGRVQDVEVQIEKLVCIIISIQTGLWLNI
jgi:hypothetical protein